MITSNGYGISQESSLKRFLFLLYVNDLPNAVQSVPQLFADDTCLSLKFIRSSGKISKLNFTNNRRRNIFSTEKPNTTFRLLHREDFIR